MGSIQVSLSDELLEDIQQQMNLVQAGSISEQVEYFLKPWIEEVESSKKEGRTISQGIKLEKYIHLVDGEHFRLLYHTKDGGIPKVLSKQNKNVEKLNELSRRMQQCNWDREEWKKNLEELFPDYSESHSLSLPHSSRQNIYPKNNGWEIRFTKKNKKVLCYTTSFDDARLMRDYLRAQPDFEWLMKKKEEVEEGKFSKYVLELAKQEMIKDE